MRRLGWFLPSAAAAGLVVLIVAGVHAAAPASGPARVTVAVTLTDAVSDAPLADVGISRLATDGTPQSPIGTTDAAGRIALSIDPTARSGFLAVAPGRAVTTFGFWGAVPADLRVAMKPAARLSGRLFDAQDAPVAGSIVQAVWLDLMLLRSINYGIDSPAFKFELTSTTDVAGRFAFDGPDRWHGGLESLSTADGKCAIGMTWPRAPAYVALFAGTFELSPKSVRIDDPWRPSPHPAPSVLTVRLHVVDDATGRPIAGPLHVAPGGRSEQGQSIYAVADREMTLPGPDVAWRFEESAEGLLLRVRAAGYAERPTRLIKPSEGAVDIELRLPSATTRPFAVLNPDGRPAAGARAFLSTPTQPLTVEPDADGERPAERPVAVAGGDGVVAVPVPGERYRLAIAADAGWAEVDPASLAPGAPVRLTPWAAATLHVRAGRPAVGVDAATQSGFSQNADCWINWSAAARTDTAGIAALPHLKSGLVMVDLSGGGAAADARAAQQRKSLQWDLAAGERFDTTVAEGPYTLRARLVPLAGFAASFVSLELMGPPVSLPADLETLPSGRRRHTAERAVEQAGSSARRRGDGMNADVGPGGSLNIVGLDPGTYRMTAFFRSIDGKAESQDEHFFTLPANGPSVADLGALQAAGPSTRPAGGPVPAMTATGLDGKAFNFAGLRGHWGLLDFWGTWCPSCVAEEPTLRAAYDGWAKDGRLVMVGVSVDDTPQKLADYVARRKLPWRQTLLGDRADTDVPDRLGVTAYPTALLIAPDGTLTATDLRGPALLAALSDNIGPAAAAKSP